MLKPVLSVFVCDDDILRDCIKFFFMFGKEKLRISDDYLMKNLGELMDGRNKALLESKTLLTQPFDSFYKHVVMFIDQCDDFYKNIGNHIEFKHSRNVIWEFFKFLINQNDNIKIKKTVVTNHIKNTELYYESVRFANMVDEISEELLNDKHPFNMSIIENVFFLLSKIISIYNFVRVNNVVVESISRVVSSNEINFDQNSLNDIQNVIEEMSNSTVSSAVDELVLDEDNFDIGIENLNYPIVPVTVFNDLKLFQEKRVFLFVGKSGVGKSMILCHIAAEMWLTDAYKKAPKEAVFYFTMENLKEEVTARIVANAFYSKCNMIKSIDDIVAKKFTSTEKNVLLQKVKDAGRSLIIEYLPPKIYGATMMRNLIKKHIFESGVTPYAIIVDYIDLLRSESKRVKEESQELGEIVNEGKALASEFSVPWISVSHLNSDGCRLVEEDMASLGGRQMGKSLRKYENADVIIFANDSNSGGMAYGLMKFYVSKHRYASKQANKIYEKMYLPEHSFLGKISDLKKGYGAGNNVDDENSGSDGSLIFDIFSDNTIGL